MEEPTPEYYVIISRDNPNHFVKIFEGDDAGDDMFVLSEGSEDAAVWELADAEEFIKANGIDNVITIKASNVDNSEKPSLLD